MPDITATVATGATPSRLWDLVADLDRWAERLPTVTSIQRLEGSGVGARYALRQPGLPGAVYEIVEWVPDRSFVWVARAPGVATTAGHAVTASEGGARLDLTLEWTGPLAGVVRALLGGKARRMVETEAATFGRLADSA